MNNSCRVDFLDSHFSPPEMKGLYVITLKIKALPHRMGAKERGVWGQLRASLPPPPPTPPSFAPQMRRIKSFIDKNNAFTPPPPPANELADIFAFISLNREKTANMLIHFAFRMFRYCSLVGILSLATLQFDRKRSLKHRSKHEKPLATSC